MNLKRRRVVVMVALALCLAAIALANSPVPTVWATRHTLEYRVNRWLWTLEGTLPQSDRLGSVRGWVHDPDGKPIPEAWILFSTWNGVTYTDRTDFGGRYEIPLVPVGSYRPIVQAIGYQEQLLGAHWGGVQVGEGGVTEAVAVLRPDPPRDPATFRQSEISDAAPVSCDAPLARSALRREMTTTLLLGSTSPVRLYVPQGTGERERLPLLVTIYPGPVESYECVSVAMAAAGYSVAAIGPAYNLDLEATIDELEALVGLARDGKLPHSDGQRIALLAGSYSAILAHRIVERQPSWVRALVMLGPPTDLFEARRRYEEGSYIPPFGLDRLLIALGLPDRQPTLYWRYSPVFHVSPGDPPTLLVHSRHDEIVPYQQSERMAQALKEEEVDHELVLFDGPSHYLLDDGPQALEIYDLTLAFLEKWLADGT